MNPVDYSGRDAVGMTLAYLEDEDELLDAILSRYAFRGDELTFVLTLARLVSFGRDKDELRELLYEVALAQAGR